MQAYPILNSLEKSYQSKKYSDLTNYLDGLRDNSTKDLHYSSMNIIDREIIDGYYEFKVEIEQNTRDETNTNISSVDRYFVSILRFENKIIHYRIEEKIYEQNLSEKWIEKFKLIKEKTDSSAYSDLENSYLEIYGAKLRFGDIFVDNVLYGSHCGFGGQDPVYREQLNYFIQNKAKKDLQNWLVSATPELQLYAIDGILTLSKKGVRFKDETYALIEVIANKEGNVNTCSGCTHWKTTIKSEVEILLKKHDLSDQTSIRKATFQRN